LYQYPEKERDWGIKRGLFINPEKGNTLTIERKGGRFTTTTGGEKIVILSVGGGIARKGKKIIKHGEGGNGAVQYLLNHELRLLGAKERCETCRRDSRRKGPTTECRREARRGVERFRVGGEESGKGLERNDGPSQELRRERGDKRPTRA